MIEKAMTNVGMTNEKQGCGVFCFSFVILTFVISTL